MSRIARATCAALLARERRRRTTTTTTTTTSFVHFSSSRDDGVGSSLDKNRHRRFLRCFSSCGFYETRFYYSTKRMLESLLEDALATTTTTTATSSTSENDYDEETQRRRSSYSFSSSESGGKDEDNQKIVDRTRVRAVAGRGGKGCASFRRDGGSRGRRGADGGNGGDGGDVVLRAVGKNGGPRSLGHVGNLVRAGNGGNGGKERMQGKRGKTKVVEVPVGTVVWEEEERGDFSEKEDENIEVTRKMMANWGSSEPVYDDNDDDDDDDDYTDDDDDEKEEEELGYIKTAHLRPRGYKYGVWRVLADLSEHEDEFTLAKGGKGGKGNASFPVGKTAGEYEPGEPGTERRVVLELKTVADVGFIGFPNAGKSTMLTALTNAKPKIAPYAFTTLSPQFGVREVDLDRDMETKVSLTFADVPGLLPGAHRNRGLGHDFLRHVERCRVHAYIVDATGGGEKSSMTSATAKINPDGDDENGRLPENSKETNKLPHEALIDLVNELETYKPDITKTTPAIVVVNKMDLLLIDGVKNESEKAVKKKISASIAKAIGSLGKDASSWEIVFASGKTGKNVDEVLEAASRAWKRMHSSSTSSNNSNSDDDDGGGGGQDIGNADSSLWSDPNRF